MTASLTRPENPPGAPRPMLSGQRSRAELVTIRAFLLIHRYFTQGAFKAKRLFEKFGWVWQVRWPTAQRLARLAKPPATVTGR